MHGCKGMHKNWLDAENHVWVEGKRSVLVGLYIDKNAQAIRVANRHINLSVQIVNFIAMKMICK